MKKLIALGFFDSVHRGHTELLRRTVSAAKSGGFLPAAVTFDDKFFSALGKNQKTVFTAAERAPLMKKRV
jgi:FAD synthase